MRDLGDFQKRRDWLKPDETVEETRIDDLEPVDLPRSPLVEDLTDAPSRKEAEPRGKGLDAAPFGLLALIGAGLAGYGAAGYLGLVKSDATVDSDLAVYLPPFLVLLGGLLFVVMAYYFVRTLLGGDQGGED